MAESVNNDCDRDTVSIKQQLTRTAKILIHGPDKGSGRDKIWIVRLLLIIVLLMGISTEGLVSPLVLYLLHSPRCFSSVQLAYFLVVLMGAGGAASLFVVGYLNKLLSDYGILMLGMVSALFGKLWLIVPFSNPSIGPYGCKYKETEAWATKRKSWLSHLCRDKMAAISQTIFLVHSCDEKLRVFIKIRSN